MSITARLPQVPRQKESGELDVFEAAGYFSGANEIYGTNFTPMMRSSGRMSLDIPMMRSSFPAPNHQKKAIKDDQMKNKQPNSPGGKLASFLSSLFNQASSKKKKSKISSTKNTKDDQDHEVGRRKRRSSISHFRSVNTTFSTSSDSKSSSFYSSLNSELKTPNTCTKSSCEDFESHNSVGNPVNNVRDKFPLYRKTDEKKINKTESSWLDEEKFEFGINSNEFSLEKYNNFANGVLGDQVIDHSSDDGRNFRKLVKDEDEGAESDSSSDLFELQNYDLVSCYSSDLPVYETTNMNSINRGAPIASAAI